MTEISIIVPVYNIEHLLPKCVNSILAQSFTKFELILVDDGSTDRSAEICDRYANLDNRVKVIHKKNGGTASSRNAGLAAAQGKYIGFVDNDDYINKYMFETLYNYAINHSSDIVVCDYRPVEEEEFIDTEKLEQNNKVQSFNNKEALDQIYTAIPTPTFIYPWNKLFKKEMFDDIRYEEGNLYDDETVAHKILFKSKKVTYVKTALYYYVQRKGSMVNSPFHIKKLGRVYALKEREVFFRTKKETELHQKALKHYMDTFFWYFYMAKTNLKDVDNELRALKRTFDKSLIHLIRMKGISWKQKLICVVFSINPSLYELIGAQKIKGHGKQV